MIANKMVFKFTFSPDSTAAGTSTKSFKFLSGRITLLIPYRWAAKTCIHSRTDTKYLM